MGKNIEDIKSELIAIYQSELEGAESMGSPKRADALHQAVSLTEGAQTKSDLLLSLMEQYEVMLAPVQQVELFGAFLKKSMGFEVLERNGIYLDKLPKVELAKGQRYLFINSQPERAKGVLDQEIEAICMGRWHLDVWEASVKALPGTHLDLRDTLSVAQCVTNEASAIRHQDAYYERVHEIRKPSDFLSLERIFQKEGQFWALDRLKEEVGFQKEVNLLQVYAVPTNWKGDTLEAQDAHFALVRNEWDRSYLLFQIRSESAVIKAIQNCEHHCVIDPDLRNLKAALVRDEFLGLPNEQLILGHNQLGETVSLSFIANEQCFQPHNLYNKKEFGRWELFDGVIPMSDQYTLKSQVDSIKCRFENCLKAGQALGVERSAGPKR